MPSKMIKKRLPGLKEKLSQAVDPKNQESLTAMDSEFNAMIEEFDSISDQMGIIQFLEGRVQQTTEMLSQAEQQGATPEEISYAQNMIKVDQICIKSFQIIDAMVGANQQFGEAVFSYASAMDLDEVFETIEEQYGEEIAEEVYQLSTKENIPVEEALKKIVEQKALAQSKPNEENHQNSREKNPILPSQKTNLL